MWKALSIATIIFAAASCRTDADLTASADASGYINVQERASADVRRADWCLAGRCKRLTTWYSGWYNGLANKHYFSIAWSKGLEHEVIVWKAHPHEY